MQSAIESAERRGHQSVEPAHLLEALLAEEKTVVPYLLKKLDVNIPFLKRKAEEILGSYPRVSGGQPYLGDDMKNILDTASKSALRMQDEFITAEHLIFSLIKSRDKTGQILRDQEITEDNTLKAIKELRGGTDAKSEDSETTYHSLRHFARNLNELAQEGKLDPVIGRDEEIRRVLQILSRRTKNNPVLIGEPGVGKTAIAEGLAHRIIKGDIPENRSRVLS